MKSIKTLVLGVACAAMLASCASPISAEQAVKIADTYSVAKANAAGYSKAHLVVKNSDSSKNSETDIKGLELTAAITLMVPLNQTAVTAASIIEGTEFKADGNALEFTYKDGDTSYEYKINEYGLTTWTKVSSGSNWETNSYTWYK